MAELVVASYNVHGGVDGWGRPFDVVGACRSIDADVLVLEEVWAPIGHELAADVAAALGYEAHVLPMAAGVVYSVPPTAGSKWGPPGRNRRGVGLRLETRRRADVAPATRAARGTTGLALLSRLPVRHVERLDLGSMLGDLARRGALCAEIDVGGSSLTVIGTHVSHLRHGSFVQFRRLRRALVTSSHSAVLLGDMNLWGPPLVVLFPGWRRAVRGRTWPAWRPLAQPDHILVPRAVSVRDASVVPVGNSDHRAVRATIGVD